MELKDKVVVLREFSCPPWKKELRSGRILNLLAFTSPKMLFYTKVYPFSLGPSQQAEIAEFLDDVFSFGTVKMESTGVKSRGPLFTHAGEDCVPLKPPTDRQTAPESDHGTSLSRLSHLILGDYPSDKLKAKNKVTFVPQNPQLALVPVPSFLTSTTPTEQSPTPTLPQKQTTEKRKGGPLEISRPLKQGRGKEPRVVAQSVGREGASEVDAFFNTSLASVRRPVKKTPAARKTVPGPTEVMEVTTKGTEVIAIDQADLEEENERRDSYLAEAIKAC